MTELMWNRRPAWAWSRSLPWSARSRVTVEASWLALHALPGVSIGVLLSPAALLPLVAIVPWFALRAAAALRPRRIRVEGVAGALVIELLVLACWVGVSSIIGGVLLLLTPLGVALAVRAERALPATRFDQRHQLQDGDPMAWSNR